MATPGNSSGAISSSSSQNSKQDLRQRPANRESPDSISPDESSGDSSSSLLHTEASKPSKQQSWLLLALTSGAFAAFNGAFAKLTTTSLTSTLTHILAHSLSISLSSEDPRYRILDLTIRGLFFLLNIVSNGVMWALFTRALTAHDSATQVSILNTSANFLVTAALGWGIFGERLGGLWFAGAACLVLGNVIIGRAGGGAAEKAVKEGAGKQERIDSLDESSSETVQGLRHDKEL